MERKCSSGFSLKNQDLGGSPSQVGALQVARGASFFSFLFSRSRLKQTQFESFHVRTALYRATTATVTFALYNSNHDYWIALYVEKRGDPAINLPCLGLDISCNEKKLIKWRNLDQDLIKQVLVTFG